MTHMFIFSSFLLLGIPNKASNCKMACFKHDKRGPMQLCNGITASYWWRRNPYGQSRRRAIQGRWQLLQILELTWCLLHILSYTFLHIIPNTSYIFLYIFLSYTFLLHIIHTFLYIPLKSFESNSEVVTPSKVLSSQVMIVKASFHSQVSLHCIEAKQNSWCRHQILPEALNAMHPRKTCN